MKKRTVIIRSLAILLVAMCAFAWAVHPVYAARRNPLRQFVRGIRRTAGFIVRLPDKSTRFLGPVFGPIAANALTANLSGGSKFANLFNHARRIDRAATNIEEQKRAIAEVKRLYREEADRIEKEADAIATTRQDLQAALLSGGIKYTEYRDRVIDLDRVVEIYRTTAADVRAAGERITPQSIIRSLATSAVQETVGQIRNVFMNELHEEIARHVDPNIIRFLTQSSARNPEAILGMIADAEIRRARNNGDLSDDADDAELADRLRERIRQALEDKRDDLRTNWREKIRELLDQAINDLKEGSGTLETIKEGLKTTPGGSKSGDQGEESDSQPASGDGKCPPGYDFRPQTGVGCVQTNCASVPSAHYSYTGQCICGSAGSINENPDDPNVACRGDDPSCPGCVTACVHSGDQCPKQ